MRYWPDPSVTADRTFSISAGLDASTVTPGSTAPEVSLTTPAIDACASKEVGMTTVLAQHHDDRSKSAHRSLLLIRLVSEGRLLEVVIARNYIARVCGEFQNRSSEVAG